MFLQTIEIGHFLTGFIIKEGNIEVMEILLVLDHQSLQLTLEKSASLRNTENK